MNTRDWHDELLGTVEGRRALERERVKMDVADMIRGFLAERDMTQRDLSDKLGVSASAVSQFLCGERNFTLERLSDIFFALDRSLIVRSAPVEWGIYGWPDSTLEWETGASVDSENEFTPFSIAA